MKGFFELEKPVKPKTTPKKKSLDCEACGLYRGVKSPYMAVTGKGRLGVFILGEGPGENEDLQGRQFVGQAGEVLREAITECGYQLDRDFWKQNAVRCRPTDSKGSNRTPSTLELQCCEQFWRKEVQDYKPKFIFLFGAKAVEAFYSDRSQPITTDLSIGRWAKTCVPDVKTGAWVISLYHPSFAVRTPDFKVRFKKDMKWALEQLNRKPPEFPNWVERVECVTEFNRLLELLLLVQELRRPTVIDYETSGLRPYKAGHHIWSMAMFILENRVFSFPFSYPGHWNERQFEVIKSEVIKILINPKIPKIAQNIQMEDMWSRRIMNTLVQGWVHDTMVCAHVLNEHRKVTALDFQVFANWGYEYGEEITPYKMGDANGFNRMHEVPLPKLLGYNGLDDLFTGLLYERQVEMIK